MHWEIVQGATSAPEAKLEKALRLLPQPEKFLLIENRLSKGKKVLSCGKKERSRYEHKTKAIMLPSFYQKYLERYSIFHVNVAHLLVEQWLTSCCYCTS